MGGDRAQCAWRGTELAWVRLSSMSGKKAHKGNKQDSPMMAGLAPRGRFACALLAWYDANARDLPWRGGHDPYRVWISEITRTE